jgi:beta-lactam-binding protein with PASTA domain
LQIILKPNPKPANTVKVPEHLTGSTQQEAYAILAAAGLKGKGEPEVKGKTLIVQSTAPVAGTAVAPGSVVTLTSKVK